MSRPAILLTVAMVSAIVTVLLASSYSTEAGGNCQTKLVGNSYNCSSKFSTGDSVPCETFSFLTGGTSKNFDLVISIRDESYGCTCATTGSFDSPSFDNSTSAFECAGGKVNFDIQINGKVKGKHLSGEATDESGASRIFSCTVTSSPCT